MRMPLLLPLRPSALALSVALAMGLGACSSSTGPSGPGGDLEVELRNFTTTPRSMGLEGESLTVVSGNTTDGTPTLYAVDNPGSGNSLNFIAVAAGDTLRATCTVTSATNVSEPPQVVVQPAFNVLECVSW